MPVLKKNSRIPTTDNGHTDDSPKVGLGVFLPKLSIQTLSITVEGISPLIVHAWSTKAVGMMLGKQMGEASAGRAKKNPLNDFKESLYYLPDGKGLGIPAPAFKGCIVSSANDIELKQTETKRAVHVSSYTVPIIAPPLDRKLWTEWDIKHEKELEQYHGWGCSMRQDLVRLQSGVADIRFRGCFPIWKCQMTVEYNAKVLSMEQVVNLFQAGGFGTGVCEWRPGAPECKTGEFGRFRVL